MIQCSLGWETEAGSGGRWDVKPRRRAAGLRPGLDWRGVGGGGFARGPSALPPPAQLGRGARRCARQRLRAQRPRDGVPGRSARPDRPLVVRLQPPATAAPAQVAASATPPSPPRAPISTRGAPLLVPQTHPSICPSPAQRSVQSYRLPASSSPWAPITSPAHSSTLRHAPAPTLPPTPPCARPSLRSHCPVPAPSFPPTPAHPLFHRTRFCARPSVLPHPAFASTLHPTRSPVQPPSAASPSSPLHRAGHLLRPYLRSALAPGLSLVPAQGRLSVPVRAEDSHPPPSRPHPVSTGA